MEEFSNADNITKGEAKKIYITSINDEKKRQTNNKKKIKYALFLKFDEEIKEIQKQLPNFYKNDWKEIKRKIKEDDNRYGKLVSRICCQTENIILQLVVNSNDANVLMYDGYMVDVTKIKDVDKQIKVLNKKTSKYGIVWSNKILDYSAVEAILNLDVSDGVSIVRENLNLISKELHESFLKDRIYRCNELLYFKTDEGWVKGSGRNGDPIFSELFESIANKLDLWIYDNKKKNRSPS